MRAVSAVLFSLLSACSSVEHARLIPNRIDVVGYVQEVAYESKALGMQRAYAAHIETGGFKATVYGYGNHDFEALRKAMKNRSLVAFQCEREVTDPCKIVALEEILR